MKIVMYSCTLEETFHPSDISGKSSANVDVKISKEYNNNNNNRESSPAETLSKE